MWCPIHVFLWQHQASSSYLFINDPFLPAPKLPTSAKTEQTKNPEMMYDLLRVFVGQVWKPSLRSSSMDCHCYCILTKRPDVFQLTIMLTNMWYVPVLVEVPIIQWLKQVTKTYLLSKMGVKKKHWPSFSSSSINHHPPWSIINHPSPKFSKHRFSCCPKGSCFASSVSKAFTLRSWPRVANHNHRKVSLKFLWSLKPGEKRA